jgi:UPF0755 protein
VARYRRRWQLRRWLVRAAVATLIAALATGAAAAGGYFWLRSEYRSPGPAAAQSRIQIEAGASVRSVLGRLEAAGAVHSARAVAWYLRLRGIQPRVQAGLYEIPPYATPEQLIARFEEGRVVLEQLTVVEGSTFGDFMDTLNHHPYVLHTLAGKTPAQVMEALGHPGEPAEGQFFPNTYRFAANTPDTEILALAYDSMQRVLNAAWEDRAEGLPLHSPSQALTLASMIEKEAMLKRERARIAGVFITRLHKGMRLQSDPTVIYGMGEKYDGTIRTRDLVKDTPYNTYTREGLPPTPIALPGRDSVMAAVHPDESGAIFFVATGLGDGAHHFSKTLEEHNSAVKAYITRMRTQEQGDSH